jgi:NAD(P)H-dependent FMN reductase
MSTIGIINGSTRPGRRSHLIADWVATVAAHERPEVDFEVVDLADFALPLLDEDRPAIFGQYSNDHTRRWAEAIARLDGFVFVTPEYNHSIPGALKNALDFLYAEWNDKAAGVVSYGMHGGTRAAEHLRLILAELRVATVRTQLTLSLFDEFTQPSPTEPVTFTPGARQRQTLVALIDDVTSWSGALRQVREALPA